MAVPVNARVGAILSCKDKVVEFLGYGVYVGDEVPPNEGTNSLTAALAKMEWANPKIVLDDGSVVWGCECWWGPESEIENRLHCWVEEGYAVKNVNIKDARTT